MSNVTEVTDTSFNQEVLQVKEPVVVDFWAPWCGPCRKLSPIISEIQEQFGEKVKFVKINTDENLKIATEYSISGLPSILFFKDGQPVERLVGLMSKSSIVNNIEKHL